MGIEVHDVFVHTPVAAVSVLPSVAVPEIAGAEGLHHATERPNAAAGAVLYRGQPEALASFRGRERERRVARERDEVDRSGVDVLGLRPAIPGRQRRRTWSSPRLARSCAISIQVGHYRS